MFALYNPNPTYYIPNNNDKIEAKPHAPLVKYSGTEKDKNGFPKAIGITWNCGEAVYLEFRFAGDVVYEDGSKEPIMDYLRNNKPSNGSDGATENFAKFCSTSNRVFQIFIYNKNYTITNWCEVPMTKLEYADNYCKFRVNISDFYPKVLMRGDYVLELDLVDKNTNFKNILINKETCKLFIE